MDNQWVSKCWASEKGRRSVQWGKCNTWLLLIKTTSQSPIRSWNPAPFRVILHCNISGMGWNKLKDPWTLSTTSAVCAHHFRGNLRQHSLLLVKVVDLCVSDQKGQDVASATVFRAQCSNPPPYFFSYDWMHVQWQQQAPFLRSPPQLFSFKWDISYTQVNTVWYHWDEFTLYLRYLVKFKQWILEGIQILEGITLR